ncbi:MAG: hypothetical protein WCP39_04560 [Chlamydiota bacterium]
MKKKPFFLIEVLLILLLVSTGGLFLIKNTYLFFRTEIQMIENIEYERLFELSFGDCKELFYKKDIHFEKISFEKPFVGNLPPISLHFPTLFSTQTIERTFSVSLLKEKNKPQGQMVRVTLLFKNLAKNQSKQTIYHLFIHKNIVRS